MSSALSPKTRIIIWGRAASRCAFAGCQKELVEDATEADDPSLVGDVAHIVAEKPDGPRGDSSLTFEERNSSPNLMLLCKIHHKQVDDQPGEYTVERLHEFKANHDAWVRSSLTDFDKSLQHDHEVYASYLEDWEQRSGLERWEQWTEGLLSMGQPSLTTDDDTRVADLRKWLFSRPWPKRYVDLEDAFENFRQVLSDLQETFRSHMEQRGDWLWTKKFYSLDTWNQDLYHKLVDQYDYHVDLVQDLALELTRAANLVCDLVRLRLHPKYRMDSGILTVVRGPDTFFRLTRLKPQYKSEERSNRPYPGLMEFETERANRDIHIGQGRYRGDV